MKGKFVVAPRTISHIKDGVYFNQNSRIVHTHTSTTTKTEIPRREYWSVVVDSHFLPDVSQHDVHAVFSSLKSIAACIVMIFRNSAKPQLIVREPTTTTSRTGPTNSSCRPPPKAVVILLGWFRADLKHVSKYATLYERRGCTTISCVLDPQSLVTVDLRKIDELLNLVVHEAAKQIISATTSASASDGSSIIPVIVHAFSNGGAVPLQRMERTYDRRRSGEMVSDEFDADWELVVGQGLARGAEIFDSAPVYLDDATFSKAILASLPNNNNNNNRVIAYVVFLFCYPYLRVLGLIAVLKGQDDYMKKYWAHYMYSRSYSSVSAYIYSTADTIASSDKLDELVATRQQAIKGGATTKVVVRRFDDSQHVQHLRLHKAEYVAVIEEVMELVMTA